MAVAVVVEPELVAEPEVPVEDAEVEAAEDEDPDVEAAAVVADEEEVVLAVDVVVVVDRVEDPVELVELVPGVELENEAEVVEEPEATTVN